MALRRVATALLVAGLFTTQIAHAQVTLNFVNADIDQVAKAIGAAQEPGHQKIEQRPKLFEIIFYGGAG